MDNQAYWIKFKGGRPEPLKWYQCLPEEDFKELLVKVAKYDALRQSHDMLENTCRDAQACLAITLLQKEDNKVAENEKIIRTVIAAFKQALKAAEEVKD